MVDKYEYDLAGDMCSERGGPYPDLIGRLSYLIPLSHALFFIRTTARV
ncbi:MAG: hypothetical protein ACXADS_09675 [Candidatus Thorarchaeota archaeon]